jgi:hypothetical protein
MVERVELIRGQVRDIDLQGFSVVANVILHKDAPAAATWETSARYNFDFFPPTYSAAFSISDRWGDIEYNAGISGRSGSSGDAGEDSEFDSDGTLTEIIFDTFINRSYTGVGNLNASTWFGETFVQLNTELFVESRDTHLDSHVFPQLPGDQPGREDTNGESLDSRFELGADAERLLSTDLLGKGIFLFTYREFDREDDEGIFNEQDLETLRTFGDTDTTTIELIGRLEFDWARWANHMVRANFEVAYNKLDNTLFQTEDTGAGPVEIDIPGANTKVEEIRGDFMFQDTWSLGAYEIDLGLGGEISEISQSGDAEQTRDFFFLKPLALLSYSPNQRSQTRVRVLREIAQLNFNDFVSSAVFEDDDLALGNPDLRPETTWISELSQEFRFGAEGEGVVTLTAFHHWISDVQDLLPIEQSDEFEVPGNIGSGRRWGLEFESAIPLSNLGVAGGRLDLQIRWQDSSVTDPVTGENRVLSSNAGFPKPLPFRDELETTYIAKFRQDFRESRISWGIEGRTRSDRPRFKVNELEVINEGVEVNAFIETSRYWDLKIRFEGQDILDFNQSRDRTIFTGLRDLTPVERIIMRDRFDGARIFLSVSGNF